MFWQYESSPIILCAAKCRWHLLLLLVIAAPLRVGRAEAEISLLRSYLHIQLNILTMWRYFLPESVEKSLLLSRLLGRVVRDKGPVETLSTLRAGDSGLWDQIMRTTQSRHIVFLLLYPHSILAFLAQYWHYLLPSMSSLVHNICQSGRAKWNVVFYNYC